MTDCNIVPLFFSCRYIDTARYPTRSWLERVVILGLPPGVTRAQVESESKYLFLSVTVICCRTHRTRYMPKRTKRYTAKICGFFWLVEFVFCYCKNNHCMGSKNL